MKKFVKAIGHYLALPWVLIGFLWGVLRIKSKANKYRSDPKSIFIQDRFKAVYKLCKKILFIKNIKIEVDEFENIPTKSKLIVFNHKSNLDSIILIKVLYEKFENQYFTFICKKELINKKYIKAVINLIDGVFIDRDNPRQVFDVVNDQKKLIANNYSIVLAPEGTRYFSDEIGEYKSGSLKIAFDCFIPIVQIVIYGSACRFDKDKSNKKRGPILVKISNVVKPQEFITTNVINLSAKLQESASKTYKELLERSKTKKIKGDKK